MQYPIRHVSIEHFDWVNTILSTALPSHSKCIAMYLSTFMNPKHECSCAWPSMTRMATECSLTKKTIIKYVAVLEEEGWLTKEKGGIKDNKNVPNKYTVAFPKDVLAAFTGGGSVGDTLGGSVRGTPRVVEDIHQGSVRGTPEHISKTDKDKREGDKPPTRTKKPVINNPPTQDEVWAYMASKGLNGTATVEAEKFCDHFESNGWRVGGKAPMKCWKAAVRNWLKRPQFNQPSTPTQPFGAGGI